MEFKEIREKIIGCAYRVYNKMGFGFLESVYEKCLILELEKQGLNIEAQKPITVFYENTPVGNFVVDLLVNDSILIELKSVKSVSQAHEVQLVNYLAATGKQVGLLINFGEEKVEIKRKVKDLKTSC